MKMVKDTMNRPVCVLFLIYF